MNGPIYLQEFERASAPYVYYDKDKGTHYLLLRYYSKRTDNNSLAGVQRKYGNFKDEESALAEAMDFRIRCEVQRAGNKDRERIWAGDRKRKYPDTATNCTALNVVNEQVFKVLKANGAFRRRYELAAAVNISSIDS